MQEDLDGLPFVGQAGQLLDHILNKLSIKREDIYITNCFKCRPPKNTLPGIVELRNNFEKCWPYLKEEIQDVDPKAIVLLGGIPLQLLVGESKITRFEGMEIETIYEGAKTFASFHPAYVLRTPSQEVRVAQAIARAAKAAGVKVRTKGWKAGRYEYEVRS